MDPDRYGMLGALGAVFGAWSYPSLGWRLSGSRPSVSFGAPKKVHHKGYGQDGANRKRHAAKKKARNRRLRKGI